MDRNDGAGVMTLAVSLAAFVFPLVVFLQHRLVALVACLQVGELLFNRFRQSLVFHFAQKTRPRDKGQVFLSVGLSSRLSASRYLNAELSEAFPARKVLLGGVVELAGSASIQERRMPQKARRDRRAEASSGLLTGQPQAEC